MSRIASNPINVPTGAEIKVDGQKITVKGTKGQLDLDIHPSVAVECLDNVIRVKGFEGVSGASAFAGTMRSLISNMIQGVTEGFEKKLTIIGVGYRAAAKGKVLDLSLGFSHPVSYNLPEGISAETPSPTEIILKGIDKQKVGQAAAEIRAYRPPEPYKGKGVRYSDEHVRRKEAKKK
ncbi:MAG: 50S ribosomal protein L6 [Pseudomonadales bacterium]|nr:50S ribosomal protein L6 [Pseudomonadales bacterium]